MRYFIVLTGGFYQDEIAGGLFERNGTGCKYCLKGRYVHPSKAPGKTDEDCQVCPEGKIYADLLTLWLPRVLVPTSDTQWGVGPNHPRYLMTPLT